MESLGPHSLHLPVSVAASQPVVRPDEVHAPRVEVLVNDGLFGEPFHKLVTAGGQRLAKVLGNLREFYELLLVLYMILNSFRSFSPNI